MAIKQGAAAHASIDEQFFSVAANGRMWELGVREGRVCYWEHDPGMELYPRRASFHLAWAVLLKQCSMIYRG